jgi:hypothetical protein
MLAGNRVSDWMIGEIVFSHTREEKGGVVEEFWSLPALGTPSGSVTMLFILPAGG